MIAFVLREYNAAFLCHCLFLFILICKYELFWQKVSVESLILRWPLKPLGLLLIKKEWSNVSFIHQNCGNKYFSFKFQYRIFYIKMILYLQHELTSCTFTTMTNETILTKVNTKPSCQLVIGNSSLLKWIDKPMVFI